MTAEARLIVEQLPAPDENLAELLKELSTTCKLDAYSCRQLLLGQGLALLTQGPADQLHEIRQTLVDYAVQGYVLTPTRLVFAPFILNRLEIRATELCLMGREKQLVIPRKSRLLILLSDLSGQLAERNLSLILSAHRYRGTTGNSGLEQEKIERIILQGRPVLDIYLLDKKGFPQAAARAFPGKFDHHGLGERATLSTSQNLLKLAELAREYAEDCRVDMHFGLSPLPGASLTVGKENDLDVLKKNLRNLTRYAWLQADIDRLRAQDTPASDPEDLMAPTASLLATTLPDQITNQSQPQATVDQPASTGKANRTAERSPKKNLPTPPDVQHHKVWTSPRAIIGIVLMVLVGLITHFGTRNGWLAPLAVKAFSSGLISGLLTISFLIGGFRLLTLKRLIENTPTSKIRSIAMGLVEIRGTARRQYALVSPMTQIACIYYRLTRYKRNHRNNWVISSITSSGHVPFWVEDDTGRVSVNPDQARVKADHRQESFEEGTVAFGGFSSTDEKWVEEMIYDGALIYVLGEARVKKSPRPDRRQRRAEALRRIKQDPHQRAHYDTNADGRLDENEWQTARDDVDEQLLHEDLAASSRRKTQDELVEIGKPRQRGVPFVIAETATEARLTRRYGLSITLLFATAASCGALTLWLLLTH